MSETSNRRRRAVAELISSRPIASQEELAEGLAAIGFAVTQATVSRDLEQLGAIKVRRDGRLAYALPEPAHQVAGPDLSAVLRDWARAIGTAANLVVIRTPPGSAHLIGVALDQSGMSDIVGTICGDDTLFAACRSAADAEKIAERLRAAAAGG